MNRQRGYTLTFVIVALIMVGVAMFVLTGGSNAMHFQADSDYLRAVERDLTVSGLAWVQTRMSRDRTLGIGESVELDVADFGCPSARLAVHVLAVQEGKAAVRIDTSCSKGRRTLKASAEYTVAVP